ncbi:hypothetical protein AVEN_202432-1 [Araneus ventricosus]|uniref:Uncharacterized protein n=1 Tax=Araneus ventricosus TaxID=182803 RepID=A0A4Y2PHR0_ARAVE|nr:hypothetical protein AVEN_202432-1 [Araneus ventricosus]
MLEFSALSFSATVFQPLFDALYPDSNFSLQQSCSANLQQIRHDKSANLKQVIANELVTTSRTCRKLFTSNSLQTIAKTAYEDNLGFKLPTYRFLNLSS